MANQCTVIGNEPISKGDALCVTGFDTPNDRPIIKPATRDNLAISKTVFGVAEQDAAGGSVFVRVAGEVVENAVTELGAGSSRIVATDINNDTVAKQCRLVRIDRPNGSEFVIGTCDENGNLIVQPHASRDRSARHVYNVCSYGAIPDYDPTKPEIEWTDNWSFFDAALSAMAADANKSAVLVADGHFYLSKTLVLTQTIVLEGNAQNEPPPFAEGSRSTPGTLLVFPGNITGIRIRGGAGLDNLTKTYDNPFPPSAEKTILRNLTIYCKDDIPLDAKGCTDEQEDCSPEDGIHGIHASTPVRLENVTVENFTHDGIHIVGSECGKPLFNKHGKNLVDCDPALDPDCTPVLNADGTQARVYDGNSAGSYVENCNVGGCGRDGFHFRGGDAATCVINCCSAVVNRRYGFFDYTRTNTYIGCHAEGNAGAGLLAPVGGGTGSEYHTEYESNSSTFIGCYAEGNANLSDFQGQVNIIGGAIGEATLTPTSTAFVLTNGVASRAPFVYQNNIGSVLTRIELGQNDSNGGALNFSLPNLADYNLLRYDETLGWWGLDNSSPSGRTSLRFPTTIARPRRTAPLFSQGIFYGTPCLLGNAGASKALTNHVVGTGVPTPLTTGGTWEVGDVVWNSAPVAGGPIGWICTTAGTEEATLVGATGTVDALDGTKLMLDLLPGNLATWQYITIAGVADRFQIVNDPGHPAPDLDLTVRIDRAAPLGVVGGITFSPAEFAQFGRVDVIGSTIDPANNYQARASERIVMRTAGNIVQLPVLPVPVDGDTVDVFNMAGGDVTVDAGANSIYATGGSTLTFGDDSTKTFRWIGGAVAAWKAS